MATAAETQTETEKETEAEATAEAQQAAETAKQTSVSIFPVRKTPQKRARLAADSQRAFWLLCDIKMPNETCQVPSEEEEATKCNP